MSNYEVVKPDGKDLASRTSALKLRCVIEDTISHGKRVSVDLADVLSISESYADELFAVLVEKHGLEWFSNNVTLSHHAPSLLRSIAIAIKRRSDKRHELFTKDTVDKLVAAKRKYNAYHEANYA
jgi:hypothetical protein